METRRGVPNSFLNTRHNILFYSRIRVPFHPFCNIYKYKLYKSTCWWDNTEFVLFYTVANTENFFCSAQPYSHHFLNLNIFFQPRIIYFFKELNTGFCGCREFRGLGRKGSAGDNKKCPTKENGKRKGSKKKILHYVISLVPEHLKIQLPGSKLLDFKKLSVIPLLNIDKYR